jgi:hypothetical protein
MGIEDSDGTPDTGLQAISRVIEEAFRLEEELGKHGKAPSISGGEGKLSNNEAERIMMEASRAQLATLRTTLMIPLLQDEHPQTLRDLLAEIENAKALLGEISIEDLIPGLRKRSRNA